MYIIIVGMLVLLCVSTVQIVYNYRGGTNPVQLPSKMCSYVEGNLVYDFKDATVSAVSGLINLLLIVAYPLTYILAYINSVVFKLYLYLKHITVPAIKDLIK